MLKFGLVAAMGVLAVSCGTDGKDGTNGRDGTDGLDGSNGRDGVDGAVGKNGKDGIDNRFIASIRCSGTVLSGAWTGVTVEYVAFVTSAGDTFASGEFRLGQFTQSASRFYSAKQVGANTAVVFIPADNTDTVSISVNRSTLITTVEFMGSNPWSGTFTASACTAQNYE